MNIRISSNHLILLFILLAGTLLRIWHLMEIPLTHDEFSVVFRTGYDSFADLIEQGVRVDVHPAGVQVFVNYWVALFGESAAAVKIPFILFGIFSKKSERFVSVSFSSHSLLETTILTLFSL